MGSGVLAGAIGLARGLSRRSLGPMALPLAIGSGLWWLGRSLGDAYLEIRGAWLHVKLGALFDEVIPLSTIAGVDRTTWSLLGGLGLRSNLRDVVAITTRAGEVAELTFAAPQPLPIIPGVWRIQARKLIVSPDNLDDFIAELERAISVDEPAD
jgi:hypothetical protein